MSASGIDRTCPRSRRLLRPRVAESGERLGAKVASEVFYISFQMAELAISRQMFADILSLIARPQAPPFPGRSGAGARCEATREEVVSMRPKPRAQNLSAVRLAVRPTQQTTWRIIRALVGLNTADQ